MSIIIISTMSNSGKSLITSCLIRLAKDRGLSPQPFKSQNMSLNSYASYDGGEIALAQAVQAISGDLVPMSYHNPILIKPSSDNKSEIILFGKPINVFTYGKFYEMVNSLYPKILEVLLKLKKENYIIAEGAGSFAEPNLLKTDITNLRLAKDADLNAILILDIDRGGSFASAYGGYKIVGRKLASKIKGFIINKFRGDEEILKPAISWLENRIKAKYLGYIPYVESLLFPAEDSMSINSFGGGELDVAVINYPYSSNLNDLYALNFLNSTVRLIRSPSEFGKPDLVILPGSRNVFKSLMWMRRNGLEEKIMKSNAVILGICGGFQIMGKKLIDPAGIESGNENSELEGLGLFDFNVYYRTEKVISLSEGLLNGRKIRGYEIRRGEILYRNDKELLTITKRGKSPVNVPDGAIKDRAIGFSIHNGLYNEEIMKLIINMLEDRSNKSIIVKGLPSFEDFVKLSVSGFIKALHNVAVDEILLL
jgi:adenosylcobyric acid synthase